MSFEQYSDYFLVFGKKKGKKIWVKKTLTSKVYKIKTYKNLD